ncbi:MAG: tetratricopeptide repeat protein, partial [Alphaproteobacteria bacterium]
DFVRALELKPDFPQAWNNYSQVLRLLGRLNDALVATENALRNQPDYPLAQVNRAKALSDLSRPGESAKAWAIALKGRPHHLNGLGLMLQEKAKACDWSGYQEIVAEIRQKTREGQTVDLPWTFLSHTADPHLQLQSAKIHLGDRFPAAFDPLWRGEVYDHDRIRLAYVSSDFRNHAMSHLISGLFKRHDRTRFEVTGLALGPASNDAVRQKLIPTFDRFFDLKDLSDVAAAQLIRQLEIDILIDLNGFTTYCRPSIFAHRPAPLQINYLGHPATMGAPFMDYIIGDRWVTPKTLEEAYSEAIIRMPHAYQVNNAERDIPEVTPTRRQLGLPDEGFVFCCFNANFKITPDVFAIWMRLLSSVPGSVLWLMQNHPEAAANLRLSAQAAGLDPARLVFAPPLPVTDHLARHRLADVFLDTFNYNAHTTASDALWAGLPIVTLPGDGFASRVAASLLDAVGLSELITDSPAEYEALALALAQDPQRLSALKSHLNRGRMSFPLFDTDLFCRGLEAAFEAILKRQHQGLSSIGLDVADLMIPTG